MRAKHFLFSLGLFLSPLMSLLSGCTAPALAGSEVEAAAPPSMAATIPPTPTPSAQPVSIPATLWPLPLEPPLRFALPTPAPPPVSIWRPPLYTPPLALNPYDHFLFLRPIAADEVNWPLPEYRYGDYFTGTDIVHTGIDIDAPQGTPVLAAGSGKVVWSGYGLYAGRNHLDDPYGLAVVILHDFGYQGRKLYTVYAHMDQITVTTGQKVAPGDVLGYVGSTGFTTGPHLHFEVRIEQNSFFVTRNPELWLVPPQGWGVLAGSVLKNTGQPIERLNINVQSLESGQVWQVRTYAPHSVNSDDYYRENMVLSDLPAGKYRVSFDYKGTRYRLETEIIAGMVRYFTFREGQGFSIDPPAPSLPTSFPTNAPILSR
ncbi:peptidoglycan DD-metalloendopeptidase family protein [uncultured Thermanaerothrix sp.]|uniref:peptidoglycan DD-metalloendopeptidase family protein n=1 Tax=uncultured Thermanaerothrix sp. TaxID=1195149 RepID=UPI0026357E02|nr:peptidoglycan DD-metalloendopeptidase family protein [uncultured Thermanaerothrix sp.]